MQMHYPTLLPDESLYNLAARFARLNGYWNHMSAIRDLVGSAKTTSIADCAVSFKDNFPENLNLYGDSQYIQETLTTQLLARHLGESKSKQDSEKASGPFLETVYGLNPFWRVCQACAEENLKHFGIKYWQRAHQLPTSVVCHRHGIPLIESDLPRRRLHDHLWLPKDAPIKPKDNRASLSTHWITISKIGYDGLQDKTAPNTSYAIKSTLLAALRNKGLVTNQNRILIRKFTDSFDAFFGANFKHEMRYEFGIKTPATLLKGITNDMNTNTLYRVVLVYWLFGSWNLFKETCKWMDVFKNLETEKSMVYEAENNSYENVSRKCRDVCLTFVHNSINPVRNEFIKNHYRDFNWLLRHDRAWLDSILPIVKSWKQIDIFDHI